MSGPLSGIRIIDISQRSPAAAITGMTLCDYGAEVIKVVRAAKASTSPTLRQIQTDSRWSVDWN
jgi:crotonobetainyl-CoA:carnitine CoA-transferase CaiB-like acyl-CoA transferase